MPALHLVDAFSDHPFSGNPAAVCLLSRPADVRWMQSVAFELGYAETAFVVPLEEGFALRWFTPLVEVPLCGHATLASAHVLWGQGMAPELIRFHTASGELTCTRQGETIWLDFPRRSAVPAEASCGLLKALGARPTAVLRSDHDLVLELPDEDAVRILEPDFSALRVSSQESDVRGVMVTARSSDPEFDFVSRFFAPLAGIDEDPVTGSAHCTLAPFWAERLGKLKLRAFQASRRGGALQLEVTPERVRMGGRAVTTLRGELLV